MRKSEFTICCRAGLHSCRTNVLVRYLIGDDNTQFEVAKESFEEATVNEAMFIPVSVSIELEWVLRSLCDVRKAVIITTFSRPLEAREMEFQEESAIESALNLYADNNADFADCLHV